MAVIDPMLIKMAVPENGVDQIIGIEPGTFTAIAPTAIEGQHTTTTTIPTGFNDSCYIEGIFSIDGGTTWPSLGTDIADSTQLNGLHITTYTQGNNLVFQAANNYDSVAGVGHTYTVMYKVVLIAKNDQGAVIPIPTNELIYYSSRDNYPKIFLKGSVPFVTTAGNSFTDSIFHNLNYIPKVRVWLNGMFGVGRIDLPNGIIPEIKVDTTSVTFFADAALTTNQSSLIDYRIYLDH